MRAIHAVFCLRTLFIRTSASDMVKKLEHLKNVSRLRFLPKYILKYAFTWFFEETMKKRCTESSNLNNSTNYFHHLHFFKSIDLISTKNVKTEYKIYSFHWIWLVSNYDKELSCYKNKNGLGTFEAENWQKIRTLSLTSKNLCSYKKYGVYWNESRVIAPKGRCSVKAKGGFP